MDRLKRLIEALRALIGEEFSGHVKINFTQGSIGRVEKVEEIDGDEIVVPKTARVSRDRKYEEEVR